MKHTAESFWAKVNRRGEEECWNWTGYRNVGKHSGQCRYGRIDIFGQKGVYVHRVAYFLARPGKLTLERGDGLLVRHSCDNPLCCNPRHLVTGTHAQNVEDMLSRGRQTRYTSTDSPRAKLTAEDIFWIRMQKKYGATKKALAMLYEVSEATISGACYGRHYRDV